MKRSLRRRLSAALATVMAATGLATMSATPASATPPSAVWSNPVGTIDAQPVVGPDGTVVLTTQFGGNGSSNTTYAFKSDGSNAWTASQESFPNGTAIVPNPVIDSTGTVYWLRESPQGALVLDAVQQGVTAWSANMPAGSGPMSQYNDLVLAPDGTLYTVLITGMQNGAWVMALEQINPTTHAVAQVAMDSTTQQWFNQNAGGVLALTNSGLVTYNGGGAAYFGLDGTPQNAYTLPSSGVNGTAWASDAAGDVYIARLGYCFGATDGVNVYKIANGQGVAWDYNFPHQSSYYCDNSGNLGQTYGLHLAALPGGDAVVNIGSDGTEGLSRLHGSTTLSWSDSYGGSGFPDSPSGWQVVRADIGGNILLGYDDNGSFNLYEVNSANGAFQLVATQPLAVLDNSELTTNRVYISGQASSGQPELYAFDVPAMSRDQADLTTGTAGPPTTSACVPGGSPVSTGASTTQWDLVKIHAPQAWQTTMGSCSVKVAILDSGLDISQSDFAGRVAGYVDCTSGACVTASQRVDTDGHGTEVASVALASGQASAGAIGLDWHASLLIAKIAVGGGSTAQTEASAIYWALSNGANVINISLSGASDPVLQDAVDYANRFAVVVASAGNCEDSNGRAQDYQTYCQGNTAYPADYPGVIAVASTNAQDKLASWSYRGSWVDVAAPGECIPVLKSTETTTTPAAACGVTFPPYYVGDGTSFSAPLVAGLASLLMARCHNVAKVRGIIRNTADATPVVGVLYGRVDAGAAMASASATC